MSIRSVCNRAIAHKLRLFTALHAFVYISSYMCLCTQTHNIEHYTVCVHFNAYNNITNFGIYQYHGAIKNYDIENKFPILEAIKKNYINNKNAEIANINKKLHNWEKKEPLDGFNLFELQVL
ncbi:hypothetical protein H8356DRAFT_1424601 [Neocallimastix lanati (nom. inval.)]|nr:hypothetical protein H8356DRAFT_1424601 [Neocallimastix sp. JGI-2020a]